MTRAKDISKILTAPVFGGLTYPTADGSSNQFMKTDGSGSLSFSTVDLTALSATNLTSGTVPSARVSGAYTNITSVGTLTGFTSTGIDDNADALAITIDSSERVMIGTTTEGASGADEFTVAGSSNTGVTIRAGTTASSAIYMSDATSGAGEYAGYIAYAHGTDSMAFATSSTERMRITSAGFVGIGTNAPIDLFSVKGSSGASTDINFSSGDDTNDIRLFFGGNSNPFNGAVIYEPDSNNFHFKTSGSEKLRITSSGNIGIGTSNPTSLFHVNGDAKANRIIGNALMESSSGFSSDVFAVIGGTTSNQSTRHGGVFFSKHASSNALLAGSHDSTFNSLAVKGDGKVGIGTTSPSSKFVIYDATYPYIYLQNSTTGTGTNDGFSLVEVGTDTYINNRENGNMLFYNNGSERMRVNSNGQLLIGTTTPRGKLTLGLDSASNDGIYLDNANGSATLDISLLGSGYNAHGAAAGEIWFYSPDNINIGGATGNGNHVKFLANGVQRLLIHGSKPQTDTHGVKEYFYHGSLSNSMTVLNIDIPGISSAGVMLVEAAYTHYSINSYGALRFMNLGLYGGNIISTHDIQNISSGSGGSWSTSVPVTGTIRITKNAGSYIGGGFYWVKVTTYI